MDYGYKTDVGKIRNLNEDRYLFVNEDDYVLLAVADGMGGHNAGDIASQMAIDEILKYNLNLGFYNDTKENIKKCINNVNLKIFEYSVKNPECNGMGTTLTLSVIIGDKVYFANVGDSRGYVINDKIEKITVDHSYVEELVKIGKITEEEAKNHPNRNQITRAIGTSFDVEIDIFEFEKKKEDIICLCTDGFTNMLSDDVMLREFKNTDSLQRSIDNLVTLANLNGGTDNITVVCFKEGE